MTIEERVVVVSSDKPEQFEGDVIYVTTHNDSKDVEVCSASSFHYKNFAMLSTPDMISSHCTNCVGDGGGYWHVPLEVVLATLIEKNNGRIEDKRTSLSPDKK